MAEFKILDDEVDKNGTKLSKEAIEEIFNSDAAKHMQDRFKVNHSDEKVETLPDDLAMRPTIVQDAYGTYYKVSDISIVRKQK